MKKYLINTIAELKLPAKDLVELLQQCPIACFYGEMGAGKTTFIKSLCEELGVEDSTSSPTFSIVNEYRDGNDHPVYHFDFYRIKNLEEALDVGAEEYFYSGDICLIEWPQLISELIPEQYLEISINLVGENQRELIVSMHG